MVQTIARPSSALIAVKTDKFEIHLDDLGVLRVLAIGLWRLEDVRDYFSELAPMMHHARRLSGRALVLVDKREAPVQIVEVAERLNAGCLAHYKSTDRLAVVTSTTLAKLQTRRVLPADRSCAFISIPAAEHYLLKQCE